MTNHNWVRVAAIVLVAIAAIMGALQLSAGVAEAYGCSTQYSACLGWCAGDGRAVYGSVGSCRSACRQMYCG